VGTALLLRRLDGVKRVLMIGAHPDDEDTALLTALARGMGVETAYLSLTRGEGGQNLIGPELDEGLGLVRTGELLAARALDGGRQFFTRAFDFGYSKSAEETFRFWPREEVLADVTWVVRTFRPQVVISVFSGTPRDGHGHHQVSGILAHEVFDVAGDPTLFPEQLGAGVLPWAPSKLYRLTRRDPSEGATWVETGNLDPLLGRSYYQVAMESRSQHRSQDMGVGQPMGPRRSTLALVRSRTASGDGDEIFTGIDTALVAMAEALPGDVRGEVVEALRAYRASIRGAEESLGVVDSWAASSHLGKALASLRTALDALDGIPSPAGSDPGVVGLLFSLQERLPWVQEAFLRSAGVMMDVRVDREFLVPGEDVGVTVELWNGGPNDLTGAEAEVVAPDGWGVVGGGAPSRDVPVNSTLRRNYRIKVPVDAEASSLYYLDQPRAGELYQWPGDRRLWGLPGETELFYGNLTFNLGGLGPVEVWRPARFRGVDKATGEYVEPVLVVPALSLSLDPPMMAWPSAVEDSREFTLTVRSQTGGPLEGEAHLLVPEGWGVEPESQSLSLVGPGTETALTFQVRRATGSPEGHYSVSARVRLQDGRSFEDGISVVDYPHIRRSALFPAATSGISVFPVSVTEGLRVGYVMGSGDSGDEAIRQMGLRVERLDAEGLRNGDLRSFDVLVLGIRAYETRPDLVAHNDRILDFAKGGGTVIVQYNKYEYPEGEFAPYPVGMSRPHDRVSDEEAPVRILDPNDPVFRFPNTIGQEDFDGWVQERGLYFLGSWSPEFDVLLEMADPGEEPKRGGLVMARVGEGYYVYTGLAFFRQFSEGVPGAYRLFANLLSIGYGGPS